MLLIANNSYPIWLGVCFSTRFCILPFSPSVNTSLMFSIQRLVKHSWLCLQMAGEVFKQLQSTPNCVLLFSSYCGLEAQLIFN